QDALSLRAVRCVAHLLTLLAAQAPAFEPVTRLLREWDCRMEPDRVGATIFEVFFARWARAVVRERFDDATAPLIAGGANGLSAALLAGDPAGWFAEGRREAAICESMYAAVDWLTERLGPDPTQWQWGRLHVLSLRHILSGRGDLGALLD